MTLTNGTSPNGSPAENGRETLIAELVDEMTAWNPRDRMSAFRSWLKGSLSLIHLHVLTILEAEGAIAMSRLAEILDVSVASTTGIVGRMEERDLVARSHGEADRRVVLVSPTPAGIAIFRDMTEHRRQQLTALLGRLTDDELAALLTGLRAMRTARIALHVEKTKSGLVAVTIPDTGSAEVAIAGENAATPIVTRGDA
ncbi:MAG TPA: MarR family transcriptional regulator [Candidatus Deferrimicrobium sp.]|nr:MarR family transcriptional regulator [Candidatus Deferrimicrobium sp.]